MSRTVVPRIPVLTAVVALCLPGPGVAESLTLGLVPEQNIFAQVERYSPIIRFLEAKIGIEVDARILRDYEEMLSGMRSGWLDGGFAGSYVATVAIHRLSAQPLVRVVHPDGSKTYRGLILARRSSHIASIEQMQGRTIAFVDRGTTAGYVFPRTLLLAHGISEPANHFGEILFAGSHDAAISAVLDGRADIGTAKDTIYRRMSAIDPRVERDLVILASSREVPSITLVVAAGISSQRGHELSQALLEMHRQPTGRRLLADFGALRFEQTTREDFRPVYEMIRAAGLAGDLEPQP